MQFLNEKNEICEESIHKSDKVKKNEKKKQKICACKEKCILCGIKKNQKYLISWRRLEKWFMMKLRIKSWNNKNNKHSSEKLGQKIKSQSIEKN